MGQELNTAVLVVVAGGVVAWGLVAARLERLDVTAPIAFVVIGLVACNGPLAVVHLGLHAQTVRTIAELALAVVLFVDASRVNAQLLRVDAAVPARLLGIALPLAIGAGAAVAAGVLHSGGWWVAACVGAIVAPTDAALGSAILQDERVPVRIRRVLNVESGLNDGIATPFVNLFVAGAVTAEQLHGNGVGAAVVDLLGGAALGVGVGLVGAVLLRAGRRAGWSGEAFAPLTVLALALLAYGCALETGTNGFVAAFLAGLAFGTVTPDEHEVLTFSEDAGTLLSLLVWFGFGALMLVPGLRGASWRDVVFAVLALTAVRMLPVALSLVGAGLDAITVAFLGWFGPRGLASVVFGLLAVDALAPADATVVLHAVTVTVAMSVVVHGVSARPLGGRYGEAMRRREPGQVPAPAPPIPTRSLRGPRARLR